MPEDTSYSGGSVDLVWMQEVVMTDSSLDVLQQALLFVTFVPESHFVELKGLVAYPFLVQEVGLYAYHHIIPMN